MKKFKLHAIMLFLLMFFLWLPGAGAAPYQGQPPLSNNSGEEKKTEKQEQTPKDEKDVKQQDSTAKKQSTTKKKAKQIPQISKKKSEQKKVPRIKKAKTFRKKKETKAVRSQKIKSVPPPKVSLGYCCDNGAVKVLSERFCSAKKGRFFSIKRRAEAEKYCRHNQPQVGFCCISNNKVVRVGQKSCLEKNGRYYSLQKKQEAIKNCRFPTELQPVNTGVSQIETRRDTTQVTRLSGSFSNTPQPQARVRNPGGDEKRSSSFSNQPKQIQQKTTTRQLRNQHSSVDTTTPSESLQQEVVGSLRKQIVVSFNRSGNEKERIAKLTSQFRLKLVEHFILKSLQKHIAVFLTQDDPVAVMAQIRQRQGVLSVQHNNVFETLGEPMKKMQKLFQKVDLDRVHNRYRGKTKRVGVIDTGVDPDHHELQQRLVYFENFFHDSSYVGEVHGTAVAGIIGASTNGKGIQGIAPETDIYGFRGCKQLYNSPMGRCYTSTIAKALDRAIDKQVHVVSLCLGSSNRDMLLSALLEAGAQQGILFVAPAGNSAASKQLAFPASHRDVIAVAGSSETGEGVPNEQVASLANVRAPASNILAPVPGNRFNFMNGTSMASAAVAGVLVLIHEKYDSLPKDILFGSGGDIQKYIKLLQRDGTDFD